MIRTRKDFLRERRKAKQRRRVVIILTAFWLVVALIVVGLVAWLTHASFVAIKDVEVKGAVSMSPDALKDIAREELGKSSLYVFSKNNIALEPGAYIEQRIRNAYPSVEQVSVSRAGFQAITISVTERVQTALWCATKDSCFLLDTHGVAFSEAPDFQGSSFIKIMSPTDALDQSKLLGTTVLDPKRLSEVLALATRLQPLNFSTVLFEISNDGTIVAHNTDGSTFRFSEGNIDNQFDNLKTTLASSVFATSSANGFEYIDLRFGNKIFYKFKNRASVQVNASSTASKSTATTSVRVMSATSSVSQ